MAGRSVSVPMTLSDLERPNVRNQFFSGGRRWLGQPRHCICTNASRDLSAIAEFLVLRIVEFGMPIKY